MRALDGDGLKLVDQTTSGVLIKGGKVGIHQSTPVYDLDVDGSGNFTSLYVDGNSVLTGEGSVFGKWEDGATAGEIFYTGGNVGVGTINPEHDLHVVGDSVVDGNFVINGISGTFNVEDFDVSGSNITLNSAGGGLDSSRGGLVVNGDNATGKLEYLDSNQAWQSNQDVQIVADKHLQTDKVRAIDDGGLYLQDDAGKGIYIQDGGQVNIAGLTKADGGLKVGNDAFDIQTDGTLGNVNPNTDDVIKWNGTKWVAAVSPGGGGGGLSEVPSATINSLIAGESIQEITYGPYDSTPKIATDLEIVGDGSVIPYALSGVSETGYFAVFSQEIPNNNYKIHTVFGGKDVYWETGSSNSIYYNDGNVSLQRNLTVGGNLTVAGNTTTLNTQTLEIEDHNIVIASNTGHNQLTNVYPVGGDYAGVFWGTGDAGSASPVSLTYQSNKGFSFEGGNVGIGTTDPGKLLHVAGNAHQIVIEDTNAAAGSKMRGIYNNNRRLHIGRYTDDFNSFYDDMVIDSDGDVGIGTSSPNRKLHVAGDWIRVDDGYGLDASGGTEKVKLDNGYIALTTNSFERLRIDSSGNVGIGITNPSEELSVLGNIKIVKNLSGNPSNEDILGSIGFEGSNSTNTNLASEAKIEAIAEADHTGTSAATGLQFYTKKSTTGPGSEASPSMRINSNGNVGIGTASPNAELEVNGQILSNRRFMSENSLELVSDYNDNGATSIISFKIDGQGAGNEKMRIDSDGNVGIGTTGPVSEFQVGDKVGGDPSVRRRLLFNAADNAYLEIENTVKILLVVTTKKWTRKRGR